MAGKERQVCATLLGARHVPERLCGGFVYMGAITNVHLYLFLPFKIFCHSGVVVMIVNVKKTLIKL